MTIARSSILRGPAIVQMGGQSMYTAGDITVNTRKETFPIESSAYGKVDERLSYVITDISFTPVGMWTAALLAVMYPHTNPIAGTSIFGATDTGVTIHPLNGSEKIVYTAGAVTKMPDIILSAVKTAFGEMTITCLGGSNKAMTEADYHYTLTATSTFTDTSFAVASIPTSPISIYLVGQSAPWNAIETKDGATVSFNLSTSPVETDSDGLVDYSMSGLDITVSFQPVNPTAAQVLTKLAIQGTDVRRGMSLNSGSNNLICAGWATGSPQVTVNNAALKNAPAVYGKDALRHGALEFIATRTTGVGTMFVLGTI
ncbi:MAG: hypothetical protein EOM20_06740 [Spartobacteria bacterium]|nr:hypothetical protein [Spartobacteria bacterium]